jgi:glucosylglycerate phosphorylase
MLTPSLRARLAHKLDDLYGPEAGAACLDKLLRLIESNPIPAREKTLTEQDTILIAYGDHVQRPGKVPLETLHQFLKNHLKEVVSTVHILPFYPYSSDDGFSVVDYRAVDPALGTWADICGIGDDFRLMFDLVLNHVSVSSAWFQSFLRGDSAYRDFFVTPDPGTDLTSVTRPRTHPLLTPFETAHGTRHVWTTFSTDQADLNFANPAVLLEIVDVLLSYVRQGADLIRLDAIAYLWKIPGTTCIHLPQTHRVVQLFRDVLDAAAPWVRIITETNVPHVENISYFGDGRDEAQMVYQFALPPLLVHTFYTGNARALSEWVRTLTTPSSSTAFFNFTASHDGIGVRPVSGLLRESAIQRMIDTVQERGGLVSYKSNPDGLQSAYEMNITYFDALRVPGEPQTRSIDRFVASQAIMLALAGVPGIYLHSILGSENWYVGVKQTGHARAINREKLNVDAVERDLADPASRRAQVFRRYCDLLRVRRAQSAFHPASPQQILDLHPSVVAIERTPADGGTPVLALHNVADQSISIALPPVQWQDLLTGRSYDGNVPLNPYQVCWLTPR